jgi:hypothetical protein
MFGALRHTTNLHHNVFRLTTERLFTHGRYQRLIYVVGFAIHPTHTDLSTCALLSSRQRQFVYCCYPNFRTVRKTEKSQSVWQIFKERGRRCRPNFRTVRKRHKEMFRMSLNYTRFTLPCQVVTMWLCGVLNLFNSAIFLRTV